MTTWDRTARFYDWQLPLERRSLRVAVELANAGAGDRLLDLATGTGGLLRRLSMEDGAPRELVAVDSSTAMLARIPPLRPGWRVMHADARRLPLPERSFDVVTAAYLLHFLDKDDRRDVLHEAFRVLRPGGRLVVVTVTTPRSRALALLSAPVFALARRSSGSLAGLRPLDPRQELKRAGFAITAARRTGCGYPAIVVLADASSQSEALTGPR